MNWSDLDRWCESRGYSPINPGSPAEPGVIKGYKLIFNHYSSSRGGGALNIAGPARDEVCGVLFTLSDEDFQKIKLKEGSAYASHPANVVLRDGKVVGAKTFKAKGSRELYPPTDEYLEIVLAGAERFDLGEKCLEQIKEAARKAKAMKGELVK